MAWWWRWQKRFCIFLIPHIKTEPLNHKPPNLCTCITKQVDKVSLRTPKPSHTSRWQWRTQSLWSQHLYGRKLKETGHVIMLQRENSHLMLCWKPSLVFWLKDEMPGPLWWVKKSLKFLSYFTIVLGIITRWSFTVKSMG